ncbi:VOC family protein [Aureibacter tunicatorum]|uniref:PhnB protein n=1 Tax=Aureibacter tunicatorum TaxID=866807 RepID=A0AAE3XRD6_9BACT|nr:VOC family protein [Aureibacter tunicatorum]MDR6240525.1 PhnB protein [Aureibacter tunicatorum]BDD06614.1 VOC family protein [Aureibacter tunicatorum]
MTTINPYLTFNGNCEEAFGFYKSVFGGDFSFLGRFKDMPENPDYPLEDAQKELIMHISLPISDETILMGSDTLAAFGQPFEKGNNYSISVNIDDAEVAKKVFDKLSDGGKVKMPFDKTFWNAWFGSFEDKFGIHWMVNSQIKEEL